MEEEKPQELTDKLVSMTESLLKKRDEAVEFRAASGIERQWQEDDMLYAGLDVNDPGKGRMIDYAAGQLYNGASQGPKRSKVVINIIRPKCEQAEGRFADVLLPVDDRNWGLKLTPVSEIDEMLKDKRPAMQDNRQVTLGNGPATMREIGKEKVRTAEDKMAGMERDIDDQLNECGYNAECRKVIRNAVRKGTGILKGPCVIKKTYSKWNEINDSTGTAFVMEQVEKHAPVSVSCDPEDIFPSPNCDSVAKAAYVYERGSMLPRDLRNLIGVDGYFEDQIKLVLEEEPKRTNVTTKKEGYRVESECLSIGQPYETWEYNGDVNKEDLLAAGVDVEATDNKSISASVLFVNDRPVKVELSILENGDLIYDFFTWSSIPGSIWGVGVPRLGMWQQRVITAAWRAMMDNSGDSAGVQVIVGRGVQPADDTWEMTSKKLWFADEEVDDVRKVFAQFQLDNRQQELEAVINLSLRFLDQETSLPTLFNGEAKTAPETLGATNIMVDANNVAIRQRVKLWDDSITRPHITRYYTWNMLHGENEENKGDYTTDPRGTSVLYEKDQRAQTLMQAFALKEDPDVGPLVDWKKATSQLFQSLHLDIMKDDLEIEMSEQQPKQAPPDPRIAAAQIRVEGAMEQEKLRQSSDMNELEAKADEADRTRDHQRAMKELDFQIEMMKLAQNKDLTLEQIQAALVGDEKKLKVALAMNAQKLQTQAALSKPAKPVATPPTEPTQHAEDGRSYQE